jgi:hypothetical protein
MYRLRRANFRLDLRLAFARWRVRGHTKPFKHGDIPVEIPIHFVASLSSKRENYVCEQSCFPQSVYKTDGDDFAPVMASAVHSPTLFSKGDVFQWVGANCHGTE